MAVATSDVNWQGYGKVTDADSTTGWAVIKTTAGGGTPSVALADGGLQGATTAQAITTTSNNKRILLYYDIGAGNELDFTPSTGTEAGQFVWVWGNFLASSILELSSANGFGIMLGTLNGANVNWSVWTFYGSDNYAGGWKRMVIDPTKTASLTGSGTSEGGGGVSLSSVRYFGIMAKTSATARFDNMIVDRIDVGTGYAVDGTGGTADQFFSELIAVEESVANWWGVLQSINDAGTAYELVGKLQLGDATGTVATTISDNNTKMFAAEPLYYNSGLVAALPTGATGIEIIGNATGDTNVTFGEQVGTTNGRNGLTLVGNNTYNIGFDRDDGAVESADLFGCTWENLDGTLNLDGNHNFDGCTVVDSAGISVANGATVYNMTNVSSGQINLNTSGGLKDSLIINSAAAIAVTGGNLTNITGNTWVGDGTTAPGHALDLGTLGSPGGSTVVWNNTLDNGTTNAGEWAGSTQPSTAGPQGDANAALKVNVASGNSLTISVSDGATIPTVYNTGSGNLAISAGEVTLTITVVDITDNSIIEGAMVYCTNVGATETYINKVETNASGQVSFTGSISGTPSLTGNVRAATPASKAYTKYYKSAPIVGTFDGDTNITISLIPDQ